MIIGFDEVEIGVFFGSSSSEEDGEEQGTFTPERIQELYRAARRLHFARGRRARGGRRRSAAPRKYPLLWVRFFVKYFSAFDINLFKSWLVVLLLIFEFNYAISVKHTSVVLFTLKSD